MIMKYMFAECVYIELTEREMTQPALDLVGNYLVLFI